jgi:hypothetical protein
MIPASSGFFPPYVVNALGPIILLLDCISMTSLVLEWWLFALPNVPAWLRFELHPQLKYSVAGPQF